MRDKAYRVLHTDYHNCTWVCVCACVCVSITTGQLGAESLMKSVISESARCSLKLSRACLFQSTTCTTDTSHRLSFYWWIWRWWNTLFPVCVSAIQTSWIHIHWIKYERFPLTKEANNEKTMVILESYPVSDNISIERLYLKPYGYWQGPAFFLYYITSPCIDPVKQLELLDLISQTDAVTLCRQIKIQINLPCVKRKKSREREQERKRERERGGEGERREGMGDLK